MKEAVEQLKQERGMSEELVKKTIEDMIKAAYKRRYRSNENLRVDFADDLSSVHVYLTKEVVDGVYDPSLEIEYEEAKELYPDVKVGETVDIEVDPKNFDRASVLTGRQSARQSFKDIQKDALYAEFIQKKGDIIIGYYQREKNGNIYVDLGKIEGCLPKKFQSPREVYEKGDRIRAFVSEVKKTPAGLQVTLSRTDTDLVRRIIETEVPEISDNTVTIHKVVREAGYRTKIAVSSTREDVDPVGACVGLKGVRIQSVIQELEGEKIDILRYNADPREFIKNALSPAEVSNVYILDEDKREALAVVNESQLSLAIGKQGLNVRLANRLVDWNIDVKTENQQEEIEERIALSRSAATSALFNNNEEAEDEEWETIADLPNVDMRVVEILKENNLEDIADVYDACQNGVIAGFAGISADDIAKLQELIESKVEFVDEDEPEEASLESAESTEASEDEGEETYECPECHARLTADMTKCPQCGIEITFEEE